ncbi:PfkB family carbohydrate kinase [Arcticibacter sp. MXS-1]|uniref:PfkB family carbohydrate kinase n=1 Tax=Arcticibacter sp. MXS-1 TaxID=3341726 RepID=UPI0035A87415
MVDICCVGHITLDKVITPSSEAHMPGGTSFYFSNALAQFDIQYALLTALGKEEEYIVSELKKKGIRVKCIESSHTVCFENIYGENTDHRTQRVTQKADPFKSTHIEGIDAKIYHLGPLLADDIPLELIHAAAGKGIVSLDAQGYLRKVENQQVLPVDWPEKRRALAGLDILKANEYETEVLTGTSDLRRGAVALAEMGVKEVIITLGSMGSLIYKDETFYDIPAYKPRRIVDATGCGDTYMAGYLYKKSKGAGIREAAEFAAAMATLKIETSGPFTGTPGEVEKVLLA